MIDLSPLLYCSLRISRLTGTSKQVVYFQTTLGRCRRRSEVEGGCVPRQGGHHPAVGRRERRGPRQEAPGVGEVLTRRVLKEVGGGIGAEEHSVPTHDELQLLTPGVDERGPGGVEGYKSLVPDNHPDFSTVSVLDFPCHYSFEYLV